MKDRNPIVSAILWFFGISFLTGSGLLGMIAAFIAFNSVLDDNRKKSSGRKTWTVQWPNGRKQVRTEWDPIFGQKTTYEDVPYETQEYGSLRPDENDVTDTIDVDPEVRPNDTQVEPMSEIKIEGAKYLASLRLSRSEIDDESIRAKIADLEKIIESIYVRLEEKPDQSKEAREFMGKTMPLTTSVLDSYSKMDSKDIKSKEFIKMEKEVNNLLDSTKVAYTKLYDNMYDGDIMDVSSEISVLKTLLSQEGLLEDGLRTDSTTATATDEEGEVLETT